MKTRLLLIASLSMLALAQQKKQKPEIATASEQVTALATPHSVTLSGCTTTTVGGQFNFYRGTAAGQESTTPLNTTPQPTCSWIDNTVVSATTYYYVAKTYCANCTPNLSGPSNEVIATTPQDNVPVAPTGLMLNSVSKNNIQMQWNPVPSGQVIFPPVAYFVYRSKVSDLTTVSRIAIVPITKTIYTDIHCGTSPCYYAVKSYNINSNGNSFVLSDYSNIVTATF